MFSYHVYIFVSLIGVKAMVVEVALRRHDIGWDAGIHKWKKKSSGMKPLVRDYIYIYIYIVL